jgi:formylglycine-generating enzyme required for sulfatase activity
MLIQKAGEEGGTRPPPGTAPPDWKALSQTWARRKENEKNQETVVTLGPMEIWVGHDDNEEMDTFTKAESESEANHEFGWDNEHPRRKVNVGRFKVERKPVSNGEYHTFWKSQNKPAPASWAVQDDQVLVRASSIIFQLR